MYTQLGHLRCCCQQKNIWHLNPWGQMYLTLDGSIPLQFGQCNVMQSHCWANSEKLCGTDETVENNATLCNPTVHCKTVQTVAIQRNTSSAVKIQWKLDATFDNGRHTHVITTLFSAFEKRMAHTHMVRYISVSIGKANIHTHMLYLTCLSHTQLTCQAVLPGLSPHTLRWSSQNIFSFNRLTFFTSSVTSFLASVCQGHLSKTEPDFGHQSSVGLLDNPLSETNGHFVSTAGLLSKSLV